MIKKLMKHKKILIALIVICVVAWVGLSMLRKASGRDSTVITPYTADRGSISSVVSGSGVVQPIEQYSIVAVMSGEILSDTINVGDEVQKDQMLYTIDSTEAANNIKKSELALERQILNNQQATQTLSDLNIYAPAMGYVSSLNIKVGDNVSANSKIGELIDMKNLKATLPFNSADANNIYAGQSAVVYLEETGENVYGSVSYVAGGEYTSASGAIVRNVEIQFENPGTVQKGAWITAIVGTYACNSAAEVEYGSEITINAKTSGEVKNLYVSAGDYVSQNDLLAVLNNDSSYVNVKTNDIAVQDAQLSLSNAWKNLDNYNIKSPIAGTVIDKKYKAGDVLDTNRTELATVADMSSLTFTMEIDELEIRQISQNQSVRVTADALPGKVFDGYIDEISIIGTSSSGVTTYPVKVIIGEYEGLLPGMNVNAEIVCQEVLNAVRIPINAVIRGGMVMVKNESAAGANSPRLPEAITKSIPQGYTYIVIETGISDGKYVEVKSGLAEGTEVFTVGGNDSTSQSGTQGGGNMMMMPAGGGAGGGAGPQIRVNDGSGGAQGGSTQGGGVIRQQGGGAQGGGKQ